MGWLPVEERDTRYYLWEAKFKCRVQYSDTVSLDELRAFGVPTTGDRQMDRDMMSSDVERMLSINDMFEYWRAGISVKVVLRSDTGKIYQYITDHLNAMKREVEKSFRVDHIPFEDLIALDQFAATVYEHAQFQFTRAEVESLLARKMKNIVRFSPTDILGGGKKPTPPAKQTLHGEEDEDEEDNRPRGEARTSLAELFQNMARQRR